MKLVKKLAAACLALSMSSALYGASMEDRVSKLEKKMNCVYMDSAMDTCGSETALASPHAEGCCGWYATIDALLWRARLGGSEYAWRSNQPSFFNSDFDYPLKGQTKDVSLNWDWGVRGGLGYVFEYDGWNIYGEFTYFSTSDSSTARGNLNGSVIPLRGTSIITQGAGSAFDEFTYATSAKAKLDIDFRRVDVDLGRSFFVSPRVSFRPLFGVVGTWVDMKEEVQYTGGDQEGGLDINTVSVRDSDDFRGMGPKVGIESNWFIGCGFSLFANASGALVYGLHDVGHREKFSAIGQNHINLENNQHRYTPNAHLQTGISWQRYFDDNEKHAIVTFGFDGQYWWRMNQMIDIDDTATLKYEPHSEDLGLIGLTLSVRIDF